MAICQWYRDSSGVVLAEKAPFRFLDGIFFDPALTDLHRHNGFREWSAPEKPTFWCLRWHY